MIDGAGELRQWADDLQAEASEQDRRAERAVGRATEHIYHLSKATAPVLTGELKAGIQREHRGLEGEVWNDTVAAIFQETGTSRHAPQPSITVHDIAAERRLADELDREGWNP